MSLIRFNLKCCWVLITLLVTFFSLQAQETVTDSQGVIYDIISQTDHTVRISAKNSSNAGSLQENILIPTSVINTNTTNSDPGPYAVVEMAVGAFKNLTTIKSIKIEATIPSVPNQAFLGCSSLSSVELPSSVTTIGTVAFQYCAALTSVDGITNVATINGYAFQGCSSLPAITLPGGLTSMGDGAFMDCSSLKSIVIPVGITKIQESCFQGCKSLESAELCQGLTTIEKNGFQGCTMLEAPDFPDGLMVIGSYAFSECKNLGKLTLATKAELGTGAFSRSGISDIVWPESTVKLATSVFANVVDLKSVTIPGWLTTIPVSTFTDCTDLETVEMQPGVEIVGVNAFSGCSKLTKITFAETVDEIKANGFYGCSALTGVVFPTTMANFEEGAFTNCSSLGDLVLPAGASMAHNSFNGTNLTSIIWPKDAMGTVSEYPFGDNQPSLKKLTIPSWMIEVPYRLCYRWKGLEEVTFEEGPVAIGNEAFQEATNLSIVVLPRSLENIGNYAFKQCSSLGNVTLPEGLLRLGYNAFSECNSMTKVILPSTLTEIEGYIFSSCNGITEVVCNDGLKSLGSNMFSHNYALEKVTLGNTMQTIGEGAFFFCSKLVAPEFPSTLQSIGNSAFQGCSSNFGKVTLNAGMTIGANAFWGTGVSEIVFPEAPCEFGLGVFGNNSVMDHIDFPQWMSEIPAAFCQSWSKLEHVKFGPQVVSIGRQAFFGCSRLHNVELPTTLRSIGSQAFLGCGTMGICSTGEHIFAGSGTFGPVDFYENVEIGDEAFKDTRISEIRFHDCAKFHDNCFYNVQTISRIQFPDCMDKIPAGFCNGWNQLEYVVLPASLTEIGDMAFAGTTMLKSIFLSDDEVLTNYQAAHRSWEETDEADRGDEPQLPVGVFNFASENLERIGQQAFFTSNISSVSWPDHKIEVGTGAFQLSRITDVEIPAWMEKIPDYCFGNCTQLKSITWADRTDNPDAAPMVEVGLSAFSATPITKIDMPHFPSKWAGSAFAACTQLTELNFTEEPIEMGSNMFSSCIILEDVKWPSTMSVVPDQTFRYCNRLTNVDLSAGVTEIGQEAFENTGELNITFSEDFALINYRAFFESRVKEIHFPVGTDFPSNAHQIFSRCKNLHTITFGEGLSWIPSECFNECISLTEFVCPSTVSYINASAFNSCTSLKSIELNEGINSIDQNAFNNCSSLEEVEIPRTVTSVGVSCFVGCDALTKVISHAEGVTIGNRCFNGLEKLTTFISDGSITSIDPWAFQNCTALTDFVYSGKKDIGFIDTEAFMNCINLRAFPYLRSADLDNNVFENCWSLTQMTLPETRDYYASNAASQLFKNCTSLQSLVFPYTGKEFHLAAADIAGAPLEGVSYAYMRDCDMPYDANSLTSPSIVEYDPENPNNLPLANPKTSKLMVARGEKWKFEQQGYGELFDIEEMKDPQLNINGYIYSKYIPEYNCNRYRACLRWDIPLSDLNKTGNTEVTIKRNHKDIATVVFYEPYETKNPEEIPAGCPFDKVIIVKYTVKGVDNSFRGDFYFPETDADGTIKYQYQYGVEDDRMVFDAKTHKRYATFTKYGYTSWFTMFDDFESLPLSSTEDIPLEYVYSAEMKVKSYQIPVNNPGFELIDGKRYGYETVPEYVVKSNDVVMRVAMPMPQLQTNGLYTISDIANDVNCQLDSKPFFGQNAISLHYALDPSIVNLKYYETGSSTDDFIFKEIEAREVEMDGTTRKIGSVDLSRTDHSAFGPVILNDGECIAIGGRYQMVVNSGPLGSFGSPVITIPGLPNIEPEAVLGELTEHTLADFHGHDDLGYKVQLRVKPDCSAMGYESLNDNVEYYFGLRRGIGASASYEKGWYDLQARAATGSELLHHINGSEQMEVNCNDCHNEASGLSTHDEYGLEYNDVAFLPKGSEAAVNYDMTLYVRVPDDKLRTAEPVYMAVSKSATDSKLTLSGVEEISVDQSQLTPSDVRYFDLQGRPVASPLPGQTYIEVTPAGSRKITR